MAAVPSGTQRGRARPLGWRGRAPWVERTGQREPRGAVRGPWAGEARRPGRSALVRVEPTSRSRAQAGRPRASQAGGQEASRAPARGPGPGGRHVGGCGGACEPTLPPTFQVAPRPPAVLL